LALEFKKKELTNCVKLILISNTSEYKKHSCAPSIYSDATERTRLME